MTVQRLHKTGMGQLALLARLLGTLIVYSTTVLFTTVALDLPSIGVGSIQVELPC